MTEDFVTRLGLQLREAALREERRGSLASRLAALRYAMPRATAVAAVALAAAVVAAVIAVGGLKWGERDTVTTPRVIDTFTLADNLGTMGTGFGAVWAVDAADGRILRVDAASREVQARIRVDRDAILNVGAGAVWVLDPDDDHPIPQGGRLLRIDPATNRITSRTALRVPGGGDLAPADVQIVDGVPWVVGAQGALQIDPATGRVGRLVATDEADVNPFPLWATVAPGSMWVLTRDERLVRYDLATGRATEELPSRLSSALGVLPTPEGPVLVNSHGEVARAEPGDGRLAWKRQVGTSVTGIPALEGDTLWLHASGSQGGGDRIIALDLTTGEVRSTTRLPEFGASGSTLVGREIWIGTPAGKVMVIER